MDLSGKYNSIAVIEVRIMTLASEGYSVKFNLVSKIMSWRDYYMWNNNFTRAISDDSCALIKESLPKIGIIEWMMAYNDKLTDEIESKFPSQGEWKINIEFEDGTKFESGAEQNFPKDWNSLRSLIEKVTGCSFLLH
ncbi:MAG: hypothetical protein IK128_03015 [Clostridiales bacterium]|jgi:hypothetical protein|nr:hypothetical protein [Clostridiales bacterium]MBR5358163.1 hypothetical protein [Clostridiales bacterium]